MCIYLELEIHDLGDKCQSAHSMCRASFASCQLDVASGTTYTCKCNLGYESDVLKKQCRRKIS